MDLKQGMLIRFCQILRKYVIYIYTKTIYSLDLGKQSVNVFSRLKQY